MDMLLKLLVLFFIFRSSLAQDCSTYSFTTNNKFSTCVTLPVQNAFLHWTYNPTNHTADIAFRHGGVSGSRWVAWALNLGGSGMRGAQSLVAFRNSSGAIRAYTSPVADYNTNLGEGPLSFNVDRISADIISSRNEIIIYASLELPAGRTRFNQVWQEGPVSNGSPAAHDQTSANTGSVGSVDFSTGQASGGGGAASGNSKKRKRNIHGVLNTVAWGILLPNSLYY